MRTVGDIIKEVQQESCVWMGWYSEGAKPILGTKWKVNQLLIACVKNHSP